MRSSRRALESHLDPLEASRMGDARLAGRVGYWMRPASKRAQEEDLKPVRAVPPLDCAPHGEARTHSLSLACADHLCPRHQRDLRDCAVPDNALVDLGCVASSSSSPVSSLNQEALY